MGDYQKMSNFLLSKDLRVLSVYTFSMDFSNHAKSESNMIVLLISIKKISFETNMYLYNYLTHYFSFIF